MSDDSTTDSNGNGTGPRRLIDFAALNTAGPAEQGTDIILDDPFTGGPIEGTDGQPLTWTLRGDDAKSVRAVTKKHQDKRNERISKGKGADLDADTLDTQRIERLIAATIRYSNNFPALDGHEMPYTPANALRMLKDERFSWLPEQLAQALGDRKRFLPLTLTS